MGSPRVSWTEECQPGTALRNLTTHPQQPGLTMAAPRPPPAISVSVSAPAFYAPQKKFAPVVAPKPKVNPFRPGDSESPVAAGAQRAQMGRVGEIPPPPPEDFPLPPPPVIGEGDDSEGALGGAFPPPPPPLIEEPFPLLLWRRTSSPPLHLHWRRREDLRPLPSSHRSPGRK